MLAAGRGCRGCLCEDTTGSSRFQLAPSDPPQDTGEPVSQTGGTSVKMCLRKGRKHWTGWRRGKKKSETAVQTPRSEKEEKAVLHGGADIPLQPMEHLHRHRWMFLKDCSPWRTHTGAEEKHAEEGAGGRDADHNSHPSPMCHSGWREELGVKKRSWAWKRGEKRCCFNICLFLVHIKIYFYINIANIIKVNENYSIYLKKIYLFTDGKYWCLGKFYLI